MSTERVERRLTAILAADVAGYSRLTGLDEDPSRIPQCRAISLPIMSDAQRRRSPHMRHASSEL